MLFALRALGGIKTYKGQSSRAERLLQEDFDTRAAIVEKKKFWCGGRNGDNALPRHVVPFCCIRWRSPNTNPDKNKKPVYGSYGSQLLKSFRWGALQYVCIQSLRAAVTVVLQLRGEYHEGSLSLKFGYFYVAFIRNLSQVR